MAFARFLTGSAVAWALLATGLSAGPASAGTLEEALAKAYVQNPDIAAVRASDRASEERVTQAEAAYGPTLRFNLTHNFTDQNVDFEEFSSSQSGWSTNVSVGLAQPLFSSGRLASTLDRAQANRMASLQRLRSAEQDLLLDVISAYVSVRRDIALYGVASENYELLRQQRDVTQARLNLRDATAPDLDQTENRLELAAGRLIQARANLESSAASYRNLVGEYPDELAAPPALPPIPGIDRLYLQAETASPEILAVGYLELASRQDVALARANLGPQVNGLASLVSSPLSQFANENRSDEIILGFALSAPLYQGGALTSRIRETIALNEASQNALEQTRRDVRQSIASNWNLLQAARESLPRFVNAAQSAQRAIEGVTQQQRSGLRTLRDVLDVTNDLLAAQTSLVLAEAEQYIRHASLLRNAGQLTIDLFSDLERYDPESYAPWEASLAGLPLKPLVMPLDDAVENDRVEQVPVVSEDDAEYEAAGRLADPLQAP